MSNVGGKHSQFEKDFDKRFLKISNKINRIEDNLQTIMYDSLKSGQTSSKYWDSVRSSIDAEYRKLNTIFGTWSEAEIPARYKRSVYAMQKRIESTQQIASTASKSATKVINSNASRQIMNALYKDANFSMASASVAGRKNLYRITRATQQTLINESLIDLTIAEGFVTTGDLRKAIAQLAGRLESELFGMVDNKQFVQAGKYKYTPEYYAEMVGRVKFHEAQSAAARATAANYDTDLIQVSSHNTTTVICQEFEGKIFSISGKDKRFPVLTQSSPYHPNCLHLEFPTFVEAMEVQGTLDSFSAFSLGNIDRPPVPSGFIPVSQRGDLTAKMKKSAKVRGIIRRNTIAKARREGRMATL